MMSSFAGESSTDRSGASLVMSPPGAGSPPGCAGALGALTPGYTKIVSSAYLKSVYDFGLDLGFRVFGTKS